MEQTQYYDLGDEFTDLISGKLFESTTGTIGQVKEDIFALPESNNLWNQVYSSLPPLPVPKTPKPVKVQTGKKSAEGAFATANTNTANMSDAQLLALYQQQQQASAGGLLGTAGSGLGATFDNIAQSLGISTTTLALGAVVALWLLFKQPPSRRR